MCSHLFANFQAYEKCASTLVWMKPLFRDISIVKQWMWEIMEKVSEQPLLHSSVTFLCMHQRGCQSNWQKQTGSEGSTNKSVVRFRRTLSYGPLGVSLILQSPKIWAPCVHTAYYCTIQCNRVRYARWPHRILETGNVPILFFYCSF